MGVVRYVEFMRVLMRSGLFFFHWRYCEWDVKRSLFFCSVVDVGEGLAMGRPGEGCVGKVSRSRLSPYP